MAGTDLLTEGEAHDALRGLRGPTRDADVMVYVSAVSARLDDVCGPIVARTRTEYHRAGQVLILDYPPVGALTSVTTRIGTTVTTLTVGDLVVAGQVVTRPGYVFDADGPGVTVTYSAGRCATTETVPNLFKVAARLFLQAIWRPAEGAGSETFGSTLGLPVGTPEEILVLLGSEVRIPASA